MGQKSVAYLDVAVILVLGPFIFPEELGYVLVGLQILIL